MITFTNLFAYIITILTLFEWNKALQSNWIQKRLNESSKAENQ